MMRIAIAVILLVSLPPVLLGAPPAEFPAEEAWGYLIAQCEMGPRNPGSPAHARCGVWIAERLEEWGYTVERHAFRHPDPWSDGVLNLVNLRAFLPSTAGQSPAVALGAHWDTRPWADMDPDSSLRADPILGANDGASGVAVLLALARLCAEYPRRRSVEFLFFDGEDSGSRINWNTTSSAPAALCGTTRPTAPGC